MNHTWREVKSAQDNVYVLANEVSDSGGRDGKSLQHELLLSGSSYDSTSLKDFIVRRWDLLTPYHKQTFNHLYTCIILLWLFPRMRYVYKRPHLQMREGVARIYTRITTHTITLAVSLSVRHYQWPGGRHPFASTLEQCAFYSYIGAVQKSTAGMTDYKVFSAREGTSTAAENGEPRAPSTSAPVPTLGLEIKPHEEIKKGGGPTTQSVPGTITHVEGHPDDQQSACL